MKFKFENKRMREHAIWKGHITKGPKGDGGCIKQNT